MRKIFISGTAGFGTKTITTLPDQIKFLLDEIIHDGDMVLVGDCQGVDTLVQEYLKNAKCDRVVVYCSGKTCRNCLGEWPIKTVLVPYGIRGRDFYAMKDKAMANDADLGIAIWDGKSVGTGNNIAYLKSMNKPVTIFRTDLNKFDNH